MTQKELLTELKNNITISEHAYQRMQQRGISLETSAIIFKFGFKEVTHQDHRYIFKSKKQKKINRELLLERTFKKFQKQIENTALIVNKDRLVTAYKIKGKIWRK